MTTIYLVRHGEAEGNAFRRIHGQYDSLLTPMGHLQVKALEKRFADVPIHACYSSDLTRTSLTARAIYIPKGLPLHRDPAFRETNVGRWEDLPFGYLEKFEAEEMRRFNHDTTKWSVEAAETFPAYTERFIHGMKRAAEENRDKTIAIFCHGCVMRGVLAKLFFNSTFVKIPYCDNTAVSRLLWDGHDFTYDYLNDASHLPAEISTFARQKWWRQGEKKDFNLWFQQYDPDHHQPAALPQPNPDWNSFVAMLHDEPVGLLSLRDGVVEGLHLLPQCRDRLFEDQLLGQAYSQFRKQGIKTAMVRASQVDVLEVLSRYGFEQQGVLWQRSIDTAAFDWSSSAPELAHSL